MTPVSKWSWSMILYKDNMFMRNQSVKDIERIQMSWYKLSTDLIDRLDRWYERCWIINKPVISLYN